MNEDYEERLGSAEGRIAYESDRIDQLEAKVAELEYANERLNNLEKTVSELEGWKKNFEQPMAAIQQIIDEHTRYGK